jgi:hypothetical protein
MLTPTASLLIGLAMMGLQVAIVVLLARKYLRTREVGFIWLGVAVVVWPLMSRLLEAGERVSINRVAHKQAVIFPFTLVASGQITNGSLVTLFAVVQQLIGVCLLLVAVLYLSRMNGAGSRVTQA